MPKGAELFYMCEWYGLRVVHAAVDLTQPEVTRMFRLMAASAHDTPDDTPEVVDEILTKGKCLGHFHQHGRQKLWLAFDMGETDAVPAAEETKELDDFGDDINTVRYWHHPESSCVGRLKPGEKHPDDPFVHPIDERTYIRLSAEYDDL